jgi:hypothetical protein
MPVAWTDTGHLRRDCPDTKRQSQGRGQSFFKKRDRVIFKSRDSESDDGITGTAMVNYLGTAKHIGCITRHFMFISRPAVWSLVSLSVYGFDGN